MKKLPKQLHPNVVKVIRYIDDQLDQTIENTFEFEVMLFGKNPNYVLDGFEILTNKNVLLNFGYVSEQLTKILFKLQNEFDLILIKKTITNQFENIYSFVIKAPKDFKSRIADLLNDSSSLKIEKSKKEKPLGITEKRSLLKMIYGMAIGGYGWKPESSKSQIITEITKDINQNFHKPITDDTVRKWLKEAKQLAATLELED